ncbi:MAG: tetratricopeptide repeat protein, partial [Saprospiraceae bacterium]|nr:tetratricopeptide repeat protein [Saprospiraceae bacterium]
GLSYADTAMRICVEKRLLQKVPSVNYHYALLYRNKGDFDQAHQYLDKFTSSHFIVQDTAAIIRGLQVRTSIYFEEENFAETIANAQSLYELSRKQDNSNGQIDGLSFMALVLSEQNKVSDAIEQYHKAIDVCQNTGDSTRLAAMYNNLAGAYLKANDYDKAIEYYELTKAMDLRENYTWGIFNSYHNIGNVYIWKEDFSEAQRNLEVAYEMQQKIGSVQELVMTAYKLGYVLAKNGRSEQGIKLLEESLQLARENGYRFYEEQALKYLSEVFSDRELPTKALSYYREYKAISDSIWKDQLAAKTEELQLQYATTEHKAQIARLDADNQLKDLKLIQASRTRLALISGIILLAVIATLIWRNNLLRKKTNIELRKKNKIIADNLQEKEILLREIHHRVKNNLQIISSLLSLQSRNVDDSAVKNAMKAGQDRVRSMALIHQNLYQEGDLIGVDAANYIKSLTASLWHSYNIEEDRISLNTEIDPLRLDVDVMIPMGLILNELISNALKYAFADGRQGMVYVGLHAQKNELKLIVRDDGVGISRFPVTNQKKSMGMKLINAFTQKLHGKIEIRNSEGTEVILNIPNKAA